MPMFAIITFRNEGPIKTWQAVRATNVHNARTKPLAHAMPGAPPPKHLIGTGDLERDVKQKLRAVKIDPDRMRKNGVIAYEAILTASSAFFDTHTEVERAERLAAWTKAQVAWAMERYGAHRIASMVLHDDEKTPHCHLVVLPLDVKSDKRCTDKAAMRWKLVGRTISGPGRFDEVQDAYSAAMAQFGLVRGVRDSKRKHEPVPVYLKRMAAKEAAVDDAKRELSVGLEEVAVQRHQNGRDRTALDAGFAELARVAGTTRDDRERIAADAAALEAAKIAHAALSAMQVREIDASRERLAFDRQAADAEIAARRRELDDERAALKKEKAAHAARVAEDERRLAADGAMVRSQLARLTEMEDELQRDMAAQRDDRDAAAAARKEAAADRAAAAAERASVREVADKLNAHRDRLLPTMRAARDFRLQIAALKGQALTPVASSTRAAVDALSRAASDAHVPPGETRPDVVAMYDRIRRQGAAIGG
ncbi:plasmid recombination protein [Sphingomonas aquatilis]